MKTYLLVDNITMEAFDDMSGDDVRDYMRTVYELTLGDNLAGSHAIGPDFVDVLELDDVEQSRMRAAHYTDMATFVAYERGLEKLLAKRDGYSVRDEEQMHALLEEDDCD